MWYVSSMLEKYLSWFLSYSFSFFVFIDGIETMTFEYYQWVALIFSCYFIFMLWVFPFFLFIDLKLFTPSVLVNVVNHFRLKFFFECCLLIQISRYNSLKFYFNLEYFYVFLSLYFVIYNIVGYSNLVWFLCVLEFEEHAFNFFWFWESGLRN